MAGFTDVRVLSAETVFDGVTLNPERDSVVAAASQTPLALVGIRGDGGTSHHQSRDEGAEQGFAAAPGVVHELEEGEVERKLLL